MVRLTYDDLKNCHALVREANDLTERLQRLRSMAEQITIASKPYVGFSCDGSSDRVGNLSAALVDMEAEGQRRIEAYFDNAQQVSLAIDSIPDSTQRTILRLRYLDGLMWEEISEKTHYNERWCRELHKRGLVALGVQRQP